MIETKGTTEEYKGTNAFISPTAQATGVFSLCSGGVPVQGGFGRIPGKTIRDSGVGKGAAISIYQYGQKIVVQRYSGIEIFNLSDLAPNIADYVYDNEGNIVTDSFGIPVTQ